MSATSAPTRTVGRVVLMDPSGRVLLLSSAPGTIAASRMWHVPGGRVENGETTLDTARREAREETGIDLTGHMLTHIWQRDTAVTLDGVDYSQHEDYYVAHVDAFDVDQAGRQGDESYLDGHSWMGPTDIAAEQGSGALIAPPDLAARLAVMRRYGAPHVPVSIAGAAEDYPKGQLERGIHAAAIWWAARLNMTGTLATRFEELLAAEMLDELERRDKAGYSSSRLTVEYELAERLIGTVAERMGLASVIKVPFGATTRITTTGVLVAHDEDDPLASMISTTRTVVVSRNASRPVQQQRDIAD